jgi:hypothetical protein
MNTPLTLTRIRPVRNQVYTAADIYNTLYLMDSPCLMVKHGDLTGPVQESHVTIDGLLGVPGFADSLWKFQRTTSESIPVFIYAGHTPATEIVDIVEYKPKYHADKALWITPKGFPRERDDL